MYSNLHEENTAFSAKTPALQLFWDSTSLGLFKECPRKYQYTMLDGWKKKGGALPLTFGIHYHAALERYDHAKCSGADHDEATREAVRYLLNQDRSWDIGDSYRNTQTLIRAVIWYLEHFSDDAAKTVVLSNGKPAVELSFQLDIGITSNKGEAIKICGHLDRVAEFQDSIYVLDRKTTKYSLSEQYFAQYSPDNQMSLYSFASTIVLDRPASGVIIDAVQLAVGFVRFARQKINHTPSMHDEWLEDAVYWITQAERCAETGFYPMNDKACHKYNGCDFRDVCGKDKNIRPCILNTEFEKRIWNPAIARGDV